MDQFAGHLADKNGRVVISQVEDGAVNAELFDKRVFIRSSVADGANDAEKVDAGDGLFVYKLLHCPGKDLGDSQRSSDGR